MISTLNSLAAVDVDHVEDGSFWTTTRIGLVSAAGVVVVLLLVALVGVVALVALKQSKKQQKTRPSKLKAEV